MRTVQHETLRRLFSHGAGLILPGAFNALAARVIETAGHEVVFVTGAGLANGYLGAPDLGLLTMTELAAQVGAMSTAVDVPLFVDADTGFGNALNVRRTVQLLEQAGASAIMIEDQTFPKRCGHFDGKSVVPTQEMVGKIKAALDARRDDRIMIVARTDSRAVEGYAAAVDRARQYQEAGADALFIEAPLTVEELLSIPKDVPGIHMCNMVIGGKTPLLPRAQLAETGYAGICYANAALQASIHAMQIVMGHLHETGHPEGIEHLLVSFQDRQKVLNAGAYEALEERYR